MRNSFTMLIGGIAIVAGCLGPATPARADAVADQSVRLTKALDGLGTAMSSLHRESFDTDAVVEQAGRNPEKLYAWVCGHTRYVPYAGALRGPRGVLMDQVGSDLDRALLLAQLLISSGYEVRLARAQLTEDEARQRLDAGAAAGLPEASRATAGASIVTLLKRSETQSGQIVSLITAASNSAQWPADQLQAARDHWWIQYNQANKWIDLDPAAPNQTAGSRLGNATPQNYRCAAPDLAAQIPADQWHTVMLQVMVERWQGGKLLADQAVSWTIRTCDQPQVHIHLVHSFKGVMEAYVARDEAAKLKPLLLEPKRWRPILMNGIRLRGTMDFDESGILSKATNGAAAVGGGVQQGFGAFGAAAAGESNTKAATVLTAEWLDITIKGPGHPPQVIRREVFDSIGPAARASAAKSPLARPEISEQAVLQRAAAMAGRTDNLIASCRYPVDYILYQQADRLVQEKANLLKTVGAKPTPASRALFGQCIFGNSLETMGWARAFAHTGDATYVDRPTVARLITRDNIAADGKVHHLLMCDLAAAGESALVASSTDRFATVVRRGVADTLCEDFAVGRKPTDATDPEMSTTGDVFENLKPTQMLVLRAPTDKPLDSIATSAEVKARIIADLAAGNVVVVPNAPVAGRLAWWRVNPQTGLTVGVLEDGRCGSTVENAEQQAIPAEASEDGLLQILEDQQRLRHWGPLSEDIARFRGVTDRASEAFFDCWKEAYEILFETEWVNPP